MKKKALLILQTLVSISLLAWIFGREEFRHQTGEVLRTANPWWLLAGLGVAGVMNLLGAVRWGIFVRVTGLKLTAWEVLRLSWIGLFFNNFLVGVVGGDAVKVVWLCAKGHPKFPALLSVLMDRMSGLGALVIASLALMLSQMAWLSRSPVVGHLINFVFIYLAVIVALTALSFVLAARGMTERIPQWMPGRAWIVEFTGVYFEFVVKWRQSLCGAALSVVMLAGYFLTFYCSARAFGVHVPVLEFCAIMPTVDIISSLPVSLGGFGVREKLFEVLMSDLFGTSAALAVSISLGGALLNMAWGLMGALLLPSYRRVTGGRTEV